MKNSLHIFSLLVGIISCGQPAAPLLHSDHLNKSLQKVNAHTNLLKYLNETKWNNIFPQRYGVGLKDTINHIPDFYSFKSFVTAAKVFPLFLSNGNDTVQRRELAAFLANVAQETSGGWANAPGGYFIWGLYFLEEKQEGQPGDYADTTKKAYPPVSGKTYFGRGPKQLSWNYNYGQFGEAWFGVRTHC